MQSEVRVRLFTITFVIACVLVYQTHFAAAQFNFGGVFDLNLSNGAHLGLAGAGYSGLGYTPSTYLSTAYTGLGGYNPWLYSYSAYPYSYSGTVPGLGVRYGYYR